MSYVRKAKKGYYGVAVYHDENGKRRQKSAGCFKLKREANQAAVALENKLNTINQQLKDITIVDYYWRWYELYEKDGITSVTQNRYNVIGGVLDKYWGETKLRAIKRSDYQAFINWYGKDHAHDSVSKLNNAVRAAVGYAIDDDIISKDFTHNVKLVYSKDKERQVEYLNNAELQSLKAEVIKGLDHHNTSRYMILTAIYTGMRKAEIQALTWKDIDFLHATITIDKSWDEIKKTFKPAKTASSNRTIKVNRKLLDCLQDLKANYTTMVFQNVLGTVPTGTALNKCLRSIMSTAGIKKQGFHFHSLRHVHVAFLLSHGVDIYAISKRLGHSNITVTLNTYSYLVDEYKAKNDTVIIEKLAEL